MNPQALAEAAAGFIAGIGAAFILSYAFRDRIRAAMIRRRQG